MALVLHQKVVFNKGEEGNLVMTCNCRLAYSRKSDLYSTCNQKACWRLLFDYALEKYKKLGLCPAIELVCA